MLAKEVNGNDAEGDKIDNGVQPNAEFVNALSRIGFVSNLQTLKDHVEDDDQGTDDESTDQDCIQEGHVAQTWQVVGDGEIEGYKYQQVTAGDINPFAVIPQEESDPGYQDEQPNREKQRLRTGLEWLWILPPRQLRTRLRLGRPSAASPL